MPLRLGRQSLTHSGICRSVSHRTSPCPWGYRACVRSPNGDRTRAVGLRDRCAAATPWGRAEPAIVPAGFEPAWGALGPVASPRPRLRPGSRLTRSEASRSAGLRHGTIALVLLPAGGGSGRAGRYSAAG